MRAPPRDRPRSIYVIRLCCAREHWVNRRGSQLVTRYGFKIIRRLLQKKPRTG